ncbi:hypothetical protein GQ44DRAFT_742765 [Phaeosphaeriaceae sp. PMI808]|nr:hypothetical protein GQ44DRAFT_742765 [Phaeosphaeriaceae sp. PMI808]
MMKLASAAGGRSPLFALAVSAGAVLVFIFGFMAWQSPSRIPFSHSASNRVETVFHTDKAPVSINEIIRMLYAPLKAAPTEPFIREPNGSHIVLPPNPRYKKQLGSEVLILDLETRPLQSTEAFKKGEYDWRNINHVSGGVFNHYTYALIHGYDYKFIHATNFEDRHATWIKPSALANHIKNYKFIVFLDADAAFRFLHVPIEWMLNYWDIKPEHAITMAKDPWDPKEPQFNSDRFNRTYTNTGFMVVQNTESTMPMLKAWHECPDDVRYANCSQWKQPKFHEQSAFGEYVRYDFEENVKELDCGQANGFPGVEISNCQGKFIRHYWFEKHLVKADFRENIMNAITLPIQKLFAENIGHIITKTEENVIH